MSQYHPGTIDPTVTDGTELATLLTSAFNALQSMNSGDAPPAYAVRGTKWYDTVNNVIKMFDGSEWVALLNVNEAGNSVSVPGLTTGATGSALLAAANRAAALSTLQLGGGGILASGTAAGFANSSDGWLDEVAATATFTATSWSTLVTSDGRMRHTGVTTISTLRARLLSPTTGAAGSFQLATLEKDVYAPYSVSMVMATTPGVAYTAQLLFSNTSQNSAAGLDGVFYVIAL